MSELVNPYLLVRTPHAFGGTRAAAVAIVSVAVVGGCGSTDKPAPAAAPPPSAAPSAVPTPTAAPKPKPEATAPEPGAANAKPTPDGQYMVRRGDTLSGIAVQFKVKGGWPVLYKLNAGVVRDPDLILVGQKIRVAGP